MPMATPSTASVIISARMRSYRSVPACTDTAAAFSLLTARSVIRSSSFCDETTTRFSISLTAASVWVSACDWAALKKSWASRFQVFSISMNWASRRLPSSVWKVWPARSRSLSMVCTASSNCLRSALRSCSLVAARYPVRARPA